jgi:hypothetical protein
MVVQSQLDADTHLAFHVIDLGESFDLGLLALPEGVHPFGELAGALAPPEWDAFGLVVQGRARHLDGDGDRTPTTFGFAVDRAGHEAGAGWLDGEVTTLPGRVEGTIPDLCRRIVGRPTDPPPPTTAVLWATQWLDRLREQWQRPERRRSLTSSWPAIASLHPAAGGELLLDPRELTERARAWTERWTWSAVRLGPSLDLPDGPLPPSIASWMDDGFFARWTIGGYPTIPFLFTEILPLIDEDVRATMTDTLVAILD